MANNFKINKSAIAKFTKEIQREFDKHPLRVPVNADSPGFGGGDTYNGPVINISGNGAQLAWNNETVNQVNEVGKSEEIAPGYEALSQAVVSILQEIRSTSLEPEDVNDVERAGRDILDEVVKPEPDQGLIKRSVTMLKGILAPLAVRASAGAGDAVQEWSQTGIEALGAGMAGLA